MPDTEMTPEIAQKLLDEATPGPWEAIASEATMDDRSLWRIGDTRKPRVCVGQMASANARLIAAAPDLANAYIEAKAEVELLKNAYAAADGTEKLLAEEIVRADDLKAERDAAIKRAERAEAAIQRVRQLGNRWLGWRDGLRREYLTEIGTHILEALGGEG